MRWIRNHFTKPRELKSWEILILRINAYGNALVMGVYILLIILLILSVTVGPNS